MNASGVTWCTWYASRWWSGPNRSSFWKVSRQRPERYRGAPSPASRSKISVSRSDQSLASSRTFQISPRRPPGRRTRWISGSARSPSNQWNDCAAMTASKPRHRDGDPLRGPVDGPHGWAAAFERRSHRRDRFDGGDPRARVHDELGELAGPGAELEDVAPSPDAELLHEVGDRVVRITRAATLVVLDPRFEAAHRRVVDPIAGGHASASPERRGSRARAPASRVRPRGDVRRPPRTDGRRAAPSPRR